MSQFDLSETIARAQAKGAGATPGAVPSAPGGAPARADEQPGSATGAVVVPNFVFETDDAGFDDVARYSSTVPVVVALWAPWSAVSGETVQLLRDLIPQLSGRLLLATIDVDSSPGLAQALRVQSLPLVIALVGGRPVDLFSGPAEPAQIQQVLGQLLQLAAQQGVTGTATIGEVAPPEPEPVPPLVQEALDAIEKADYVAAITAYEKQLIQHPNDTETPPALAQVRLLQRLDGADAGALRQAAADAPNGIEEQLAVADLDFAGGHVEDSFGRLLELIAKVFGADRERIRERIVEYFEALGPQDARVTAARRRLTTLLY